MAIDSNGLKLLLWAKSLGASYKRTLTLGRQGVTFTAGDLRRAARDCGFVISPKKVEACFKKEPMTALFADGFFAELGAEELVSVDRSSFEGATYLHDLNEPFPDSMHHSFEMVIDGGTLEHIFDYPSALRNSLQLVRNGGHFVTIAPANSMMGHGFYQISPELFFRVFSASNGFQLVKLVLFSGTERRATFYEVTDPVNAGCRVELAGSQPMYLAVIARRVMEQRLFETQPQQSDYVASWNSHSNAISARQPVGGLLWDLRRRLNPHWPDWLRSFRAKITSLVRTKTNKLSYRPFYRPVPTREFKESNRHRSA